MAKIVCPHCQAVNRDVSLEEPCWQCGTVLGAPLSAIETGVGAPTSGANPANLAGSSSAPIQKQIERNTPSGAVPAADRPRASTNTAAIAIALVIIAAIVILVVVFLSQHR